MASVTPALRQAVEQRAQYHCEYCHVSLEAFLYMVVDHILPQVLGGKSTLDNLCLACAFCNQNKHDSTTGLDPETDQTEPLFNPRTQIWQDHFKWSEDALTLIGLTPMGRATIHLLQINSSKFVAARQGWIKAGWHPPKI